MWIFSPDFWTLLIYCCLVCSASWGQCRTSVLQNLVDDIACEPYISHGSTKQQQPIEGDICQNSKPFSSKSTVYSSQVGESGLHTTSNDESRRGLEGAFQMQSGQSNGNSSWPLENILCKLLHGRTLSCSSNSGDLSQMNRPLQSQGIVSSCGRHLFSQPDASHNLKKLQSELPIPVDKSRLPQVERTASQLDTGQSYSCVPSALAHLDKTTCNSSNLKVFEPFHTNIQFHPNDSGWAFLDPSEFIPVGYVYLPLSLGLSTADCVIPISSGSLLIQAKDLELASAYKMIPLVCLDIDERIQLEEAALRISFHVGNSFHFTVSPCQEGNCQDLLRHTVSDAKNNLKFFCSCSRQNLESYIGHSLWLGINSAGSGHRKLSSSSIKKVDGDEYMLLNLRSQSITDSFSMIDPNLLPNISSSSSPLNAEDTFFSMGQPVGKGLHLTNTGGLPIKVSRISISGKECQVDDFYVHKCDSFSLEPGESTVLQISYVHNLSSAPMQRDLKVGLDSGTGMIPMKPCIQLYKLHGSWKSMTWVLMRKCYLAASLAGFMMFMIFLLPHKDFCSLDDFINGKDENSIRNQKNALVADKMVAAECGFHGTKVQEAWKQGSNTEQVSVSRNENFRKASINKTKGMNSTLASRCNPLEHLSQTEPLPMAPISAKVESSSETVDLNIRTEKHKRRRRKKKDPPGVGLIGSVEVASSNSGASTPSSPLSPVSPLPELRVGSKSSILKAKVSVKDSDESVPLLSSLKQPLPSMTCNLLPVASTSTIPLHARAPGPNFQIGVQTTEKNNPKAEDRYTYDIWGKHFSWIHLSPETDEVSVMAMGSIENDCNSFFLYGPVPTSQKRCVRSSNQKVNNK